MAVEWRCGGCVEDVDVWLLCGGGGYVDVVWRIWGCGCSVEEVEVWMQCGGYGGVALVWRCGCSVEV